MRYLLLAILLTGCEPDLVFEPDPAPPIGDCTRLDDKQHELCPSGIAYACCILPAHCRWAGPAVACCMPLI